MKIEFSRQIFEKYSYVKFNENPSIGSRVVPCGPTDGRTDGGKDGVTDRHDEANSRFSHFSERACLQASLRIRDTGTQKLICGHI
jgi:hypothetical protein